MASAFQINAIEEGSIKNIVYSGIEAGFQFRIRLTAYRGTQLSCIESFSLKIDEKEVDQEDIRFCLNGKEFLIDQLKDLYQEYWFIRNSAVIKVMNGRCLTGEHKIALDYSYRIPYTGYFGSYMIEQACGERIIRL